MTETTIAGPGLQLSNGDHVCVFCRGGERDELLVPFLTDAELIVGVLRTHPKAVIAGTVIDNPFYIQPEELLRQRDN
jgi:hypothetical protein